MDLQVERNWVQCLIIFFLDKGARKIGELFEKLFSDYCLGSPIPSIHYINIGRKKIRADKEIVIPFNGNQDIFRSTYQLCDPHYILVVDDLAETNDTRRRAERIIKNAYPQSITESVVVYDKIPKWQGSSDYAGVEEYTLTDYWDLILSQLNNELLPLDIHFSSVGELVLKHRKFDPEIWKRFSELELQLLGSIPTTYKKLNPVYPAESVCLEIDEICMEILKDRYTY